MNKGLKVAMAVIIPGSIAASIYYLYLRPILSASGVIPPFAPIGIRNNNPGNVIGGGDWQGLIGHDSAGHNIMDTPISGIRMMTINFRNYGLNTVRAIANQWSGNIAGYAQAVSQGSGLGLDQNLDLTDQGTLVQICQGITFAENGSGAWYSNTTYLEGVQSALS